jgi:hypothetical protein
MIFTATPPNVTLTAHGDDVVARMPDWQLAWTHFIDRNAPGALRAFRLAVLAVEHCAPEATSHLEHLRTMRSILTDGASFRAMMRLDRRVRLTLHTATPNALPAHGPVSEPIADYRDRADNYAALAARMRERVERITGAWLAECEGVRLNGTSDVDPVYVIEQDCDDRCLWQVTRNGAVVAQGFGSAASAACWIDDYAPDASPILDVAHGSL